MSKKVLIRLSFSLITGLLAANIANSPAANAAFVMTDYLNYGSNAAFAGGTAIGGSAADAVMDSQGNFYYSTEAGDGKTFADGCKGSTSAYRGAIMKGSTSNAGVATGIFSYYNSVQSSSSLAINYPSALSLDSNEVLFAADSDCGSLLRISESGTATAYVDIPSWTAINGSVRPSIRGMGFNTSGDLIVTDASNRKGVWLVPTNDASGGTTLVGKTPIRIFKSDSATAFVDSGVTISSPAIACLPWSAAVAVDGTAYIGCSNSGGTPDKVIKLTPFSGNNYKSELLIEYPAGNPWPRGLGIDADGRLYAAMHYPGTTIRYNPTDSVTARADSVTVTTGYLAGGIFFDRVGNLYPFDGNRIKKATGVGRPFPPVGLRTTLGNRSVILNWNTPGVTGIETYTVTATQGLSSVGSCESVWPSLTCTVSGLTPGINYGFSITAKNSTGGESLAAAKVYATVVGSPDAPTIGTATAYDSKTATVTFTAPISNGGSAITGYRATAIPGGETGTVSGAGSGTIYIYGLTTNVSESFTVVAINAIGASVASGASNTITPLANTVPPAPVVTVVQAGPPPSSIKLINRPKISRNESSFRCTAGDYKFIRNGRSEENLSASMQIIRLLSNGVAVDSSTAMAPFVEFAKSASFENTTLSCEVSISQEGVTSAQNSLDKDSIKLLETTRVKNISQANNDYYKARDNAYLNRIEGSATSAITWKKALEEAISAREAQKAKASSDFITSLEEAGISILYITKIMEINPKPSLPVVEKEPPIANVQPSKAMKKIGTIYFATGTYFINDASRKAIKDLALAITKSNPSTILTYGHTDKKGGTDNLLLSQNRAKAVARLIRGLLPDQKIVTGWYASSKPVATGTSKAELAKNRRVEIYIK